MSKKDISDHSKLIDFRKDEYGTIFFSKARKKEIIVKFSVSAVFIDKKAEDGSDRGLNNSEERSMLFGQI